MRLRALASSFFVVLVCAAAVSCRDAQRWIRKMRHTPVTPPSNQLAPGALVMRHHGFGQIRLLCTAEESLGSSFKAAYSRTVGGRLQRGRKLGWKLSGDALKQVKIQANSDAISSVHVQIANARLESLSDPDVLLAARNRSAACEAAVRRRRSTGWEVSMITSCLRADVSYGVDFKDSGNLDVSAKLANLQAVSVALGGNFESTGSDTAMAKDLVWGFQDDEVLAKMSAFDPDVVALQGQLPAKRNRQSILLPNENLVADENTQTDDTDAGQPSWGVSTAETDAEPVPGLDDAMQQTADDAVAEEDDGFVPDSGGNPLDAATAQDPSRVIDVEAQP